MSDPDDSAVPAPLPVELRLVCDETLSTRSQEQQTIDLAAELRSIRGVEVSRVETGPPDGAKGVDLAVIGEMVVALGGAGGAITALVGVITSWVTRGSRRKVRVTIGDKDIEIDGASREQQQALIDLYERSVAGD